MPPPAETESGSVRKAIAVSAMQHDGGVERHFQVNPRKGAVTNIRRFLQSYRRPLASIPARLRP